MPLTIQVKGDLNKLPKDIKTQLIKAIDAELEAGARLIEDTAKDLAPKDLGQLASSIGVSKPAILQRKITVNAFYAAAVEFGTGKYAAQYVATLPPDWQSFAQQFKGKIKGPTAGTLDEFLLHMIEWVKRKGLTGLTKSGNRRTGKKADADAYNLAYVIVISILRNGIHPHPFLYPAVVRHADAIEANILKAISKILP